MSGGHTPGPWEWSFREDDGHIVRMGEAIASPWRHASHLKWACDHGVYPDEKECSDQFAEAEANARLIAAAPELLEQAEKDAVRFARIREWLSSNKAGDATSHASFANVVWHMECEARAAITKAKGGAA